MRVSPRWRRPLWEGSEGRREKGMIGKGYGAVARNARILLGLRASNSQSGGPIRRDWGVRTLDCEFPVSHTVSYTDFLGEDWWELRLDCEFPVSPQFRIGFRGGA